MKKCIILLFCLSTFVTKGNNLWIKSSTEQEIYPFCPHKLILPLSITTVGIIGIYNYHFNSLNKKVNDGMDKWRGDHQLRADDFIQYLPVTSHFGLSLLGAKSDYSYQDRIVATSVSYLSMGIMVNSIKLTVNKPRPDSSANNSFPSGHTATAFMGAELVRLAYDDESPWYGIGAYTVAGSVAFFRLYRNKHWLNDVIAGAGIGILSARIGYWLLPYGRELLKFKNKDVAIIPFYSRENGVVGGSFALHF